MESQTKIYKNIICLEIPSSNGAKWWLQGYNMNYSPIPLNSIKQIGLGKLRNSNKKVFTTAIEVQGIPKLVVINMQRSDVWGMIRKGLIPKDTPFPRSEPNYSKHPEFL